MLVSHYLNRLIERYSNFQKALYLYEGDFNAADKAFRSGRVAATTANRETYWYHWKSYCQPLGVDPYLAHSTTPYRVRVRVLTG
mmetsp:Transcript_13328/g.19055  ORF Transcript_13328/g.19055 Transcript_13328/m.19055 type:complete len:84 (+) Transcript_13328:1235-1486(+)